MRKNLVAPFVSKLAEIFQNTQFSGVISWNKNQIIIQDPDQFVSLVLPKYFRHVKLQSFVRQLNLYGFSKVSTNDKSLVFKHEYFQKGNQYIVRYLVCIFDQYNQKRRPMPIQPYVFQSSKDDVRKLYALFSNLSGSDKREIEGNFKSKTLIEIRM